MRRWLEKAGAFPRKTPFAPKSFTWERGRLARRSQGICSGGLSAPWGWRMRPLSWLPLRLLQRRLYQPVITVILRRLQTRDRAEQIVDVDVFHFGNLHATFESRAIGDENPAHVSQARIVTVIAAQGLAGAARA